HALRPESRDQLERNSSPSLDYLDPAHRAEAEALIGRRRLGPPWRCGPHNPQWRRVLGRVRRDVLASVATPKTEEQVQPFSAHLRRRDAPLSADRRSAVHTEYTRRTMRQSRRAPESCLRKRTI